MHIDELKDKCLAEQLAWHRANNSKLTERELGIYAAGFGQGWDKAVVMIGIADKMPRK